MSTLTQFYKDHGTTMRIAMGQTSLLVTLLLLAAFLGLVPDQNRSVVEGRASLAEAIATNSAIFISRADVRRMEANLGLVVERNPDILSAGVRKDAGELLATVGEHEGFWLADGDSNSQLTVPIYEGDTVWGQVELRFEPLVKGGLAGFVMQPLNLLLLFLALSSFVLYCFYLRKMLKDLDPSQAIPERVRAALDTMAEGLLVLDAKQNIVLANEAFATIVNVRPEKLLGNNVSVFGWSGLDGTPLAKSDYPWSRALAESEPQRNQAVRLLVGSDSTGMRTFQTNCSPVLSSDDKAGGVLISFDDITELEEKEKQLRKSKHEAEQANQAKSDFLANMSHEIRTPMTAIMGFTGVLKRAYINSNGKVADQKSLHYLDTIANSSQHLLDLINDILDLSKVESGKVEVEEIPCSVHKIVHDVMQIMRVRAEEKGLALKFTPQTPLPESICSDPSRLRQILINLVGNAVKFTDSGFVEIATRISAETDGSLTLSVDVRDTGVGMTDSQANQVFQPFVQADSSITRKFGGTGLGLSICKRFAEAMGGGINVTSEIGSGSVFTLSIPVAQVSGSPTLSLEQLKSYTFEESGAATGRWTFQPAQVLVVDDGAENRELLTLLLEDMGLSVSLACHGEEALEKLAENDFDLIIMDVQMPVMDGYTAVGKMREQGLATPVIALTANAMKGAEQRCEEAGYSGYLPKPIDFEQLANRLAQDLEGQFHEGEEPASEPVIDSSEIGTLAVVEQGPITSSLDDGSGKYRGIILRFVDRLQQQVLLIEEALADEDYSTLRDLGHWLKGSAGSVGFHDFDEIGLELEQLAEARDTNGLIQTIGQISQLTARVAAAYSDEPQAELEAP